MSNASEILESWESSRPVLSKPSAWLTLMRIAAAGDNGISATRYKLNLTSGIDWRTMKRWESAGLIKIEKVGSYPHCYIQQKALKLLRVKQTAKP